MQPAATFAATAAYAFQPAANLVELMTRGIENNNCPQVRGSRSGERWGRRYEFAMANAVPSTPLFADHTRRFSGNRYVYPVISRRSAGLSVGINLNPDTRCNFDCVYCCVDRRDPPKPAPIDVVVLRHELVELLRAFSDGSLWNIAPFHSTPAALRRLNDIAFSGDGEPTTAPEFPQVLALVAEVRAWLGLDAAKTVIITNATMLSRPAVLAALDTLRPDDEVWGKLDAGTQEYYELVDRSAVSLKTILANLLALGRRRPVTIQTLFMALHGQPPSDYECDQWAARIGELRGHGAAIRLVQVYTTARATTEAYVSSLDNAQLEAIAERLRAMDIPVAVFGAAG